MWLCTTLPALVPYYNHYAHGFTAMHLIIFNFSPKDYNRQELSLYTYKILGKRYTFR